MTQSVNSIALDAVLIESNELKYTPAGVAVWEGKFHYQGVVFEAGANRRLEFDMGAISFADTAIRLSRTAIGSSLKLKGFVAPRSIRSARLTLHITEFNN